MHVVSDLNKVVRWSILEVRELEGLERARKGGLALDLLGDVGQSFLRPPLVQDGALHVESFGPFGYSPHCCSQAYWPS